LLRLDYLKIKLVQISLLKLLMQTEAIKLPRNLEKIDQIIKN